MVFAYLFNAVVEEFNPPTRKGWIPFGSRTLAISKNIGSEETGPSGFFQRRFHGVQRVPVELALIEARNIFLK